MDNIINVISYEDLENFVTNYFRDSYMVSTRVGNKIAIKRKVGAVDSYALVANLRVKNGMIELVERYEGMESLTWGPLASETRRELSDLLKILEHRYGLTDMPQTGEVWGGVNGSIYYESVKLEFAINPNAWRVVVPFYRVQEIVESTELNGENIFVYSGTQFTDEGLKVLVNRGPEDKRKINMDGTPYDGRHETSPKVRTRFIDVSRWAQISMFEGVVTISENKPSFKYFESNMKLLREVRSSLLNIAAELKEEFCSSISGKNVGVYGDRDLISRIDFEKAKNLK